MFSKNQMAAFAGGAGTGVAHGLPWRTQTPSDRQGRSFRPRTRNRQLLRQKDSASRHQPAGMTRRSQPLYALTDQHVILIMREPDV